MEYALNTLPEGLDTPENYLDWMVVTIPGDTVGPVVGVLPGIANDNFIVQGNSGEVLIPVISDVIVSTDAESKSIVIDPIEGLLDLNVKKPKER